MDEVVRELTDKLEEQVKFDLGAEIKKFVASTGYTSNIGREKKIQLQQRARKFVQSDLLADLSIVQEMLGQFKGDSAGAFYINIDQLDENWIDNRVRYRLIRSLIEALKTLRKIGNLKVVVAMRGDLLQKVIESTKEDGFQSEKYEDYYLKVQWTPNQLKGVVNQRINYLYRKRYTKENVFLNNIFRGKVMKKDPFDYMLERTLRRPRDIIDFVNTALQQAEGKNSINQSMVKEAEKLYSRRRRTAVIEEWSGTFIGVEPSLDLLKGKRSTIELDEWRTSDIVNDVIDKFSQRETYMQDSLYLMIEKMGGDELVDGLVNELFSRLFTVGACGIKLGSHGSYLWAHLGHQGVDPSLLGPNVKARIHPMFHAAFGVRE